MWAILLLLLVHIVRAEPVPSENDVAVNDGGIPSSPIDAELASMSKELNEEESKETPQAQGEPQQKPQPPQLEEDVSLSEKDVKRFVDVEPGEQVALVQYNVAPQIISTRPGDKIAILPINHMGTPCPTTSTKSPHPKMYCQSCGKKNPKEEGQMTSYIDVDSPRECASLCARYISKGRKCDVWEYHGEWRNKQCFLLNLPDFPKCKGDVGMMGDMSFESGTCYQSEDDESAPKMVDELASLGDEVMGSKSSPTIPSWFPRGEASVGNAMGPGAIGWKVALGVMILLLGSIALFRGTKKRSADYVKLLEHTDEV